VSGFDIKKSVFGTELRLVVSQHRREDNNSLKTSPLHLMGAGNEYKDVRAIPI